MADDSFDHKDFEDLLRVLGPFKLNQLDPLTEYVVDVAPIWFRISIAAATGERHKLVVQVGMLDVVIEAVIEHLLHLVSQFAHLLGAHRLRRVGREAEEDEACEQASEQASG